MFPRRQSLPVFSIIATAANGMATQAQRIEAVAQKIAGIGTTPSAEQPEQTGGPVRIGALPLGDETQSIVTLLEAERAYKMNALVLSTAVGMIHPARRRSALRPDASPLSTGSTNYVRRSPRAATNRQALFGRVSTAMMLSSKGEYQLVRE